ncbi:MAG: nicotinate phosphoribosyltransferase [Eubacteriales bacterium]
MIEKLNLTMLTDFYELTMANGYFEKGYKDKIAYFDMFFRKIPDNGGFAIIAGLEQLIGYLDNLKFEEADIEYLKAKGIFSEGFLEYLRNFKFECDVWAVPEGTPVFPGEPLITVRGPIIQAQYIETIVLLAINHQSLIATKANRIVRAAKDRSVMEFGTRRAQGASAAVHGARAAYIGGCIGTACVLAERDYNVPATGTMAHSWVQIFDSELEAFSTFAKMYPENVVFVVDTYNTLKSGVPNAIKVFADQNIEKMGIRIDSGDITYLSKKARAMLDAAGFPQCKIFASNSLDEYIIREVIEQGACIDVFAVGERLITSKSEPVFGGVYKLAAVEENGKIASKIKISENIEKITNPGFKTLYRLYDKDTNKAIADVITLAQEIIPEDKDYELFDPGFIWKRKIASNFYAKKLQVKIFEKGQCVYKLPTLEEIRDFCKQQVGTLWEEILRFENPHEYYVDLSKELWELKDQLIKKYIY